MPLGYVEGAHTNFADPGKDEDRVPDFRFSGFVAYEGAN